jgi:hypothetical protein
MIAVGLLVLAGVGIAISLVVRPPRDVPTAAWRLIIGLTLMFLLAPATRFGYFIYPAAMLAWLEVSLLAGRWSPVAGDPPGGGTPDGSRSEPAVPAGHLLAGSGPQPGAAPVGGAA